MSDYITQQAEKPMDTIDAEYPLAAIVKREGLATTKADALMADFWPIYTRTVDAVKRAAGVVVTDATQVTEIKQSRALRLQLRAIRGEVEAKRKEHKADAIKEGRAIDAIAGHFTTFIEPAEKRLADQEKFAERSEAARKANLKAARAALLGPYISDLSFYRLDEMTEPLFQQLLESSRLADTARKEAAAKAESDRLAALEARRVKDAQIRAENERLRLEAEAQARQLTQEREAAETARRLAAEAAAEEKRKADAALAAERAKQIAEAKKIADAAEAKRQEDLKIARDKYEAKARAEQAAAKAKFDAERKLREAAEAKERLRVEAEKQRLADEAEAKRKAAAAPDREKLLALADAIHNIPLPELSSGVSDRIEIIRDNIIDLCDQIVEMAGAL